MESSKKIVLDQFQPRDYQISLIDALENKGFRKIIAVLPRRCLSGDTHITMHDGSFKLLKDIQKGDKVLSFNGESFVSDTVKSKWATGVKDTFKVASRGNIPLISSHDHVFASVSSSDKVISWKPLKDMGVNRRLLVYAGRNKGTYSNKDMAEFWGYLLSDGYVSGYQQPKFTNNNIDILKRVEKLSIDLFGVKVIWREKGNGYDLGLSNGTCGGGSTKNPIKELFRNENLDIPKSKQRLPKIVWSFDDESILKFVGALISCDGSISLGKSHGNLDHRMPETTEISISCGPSYNYAFDIYWLLRKIGIIIQVPRCDRGTNWQIRISTSESVKKLLSIPIIGKKIAQDKALAVIKYFKKIRKVYKGCYLSRCHRSNYEKQELFDIETKNHHNFIANGLVVHNSGKDITAFNIMIRAAIRRVGIYYYILPNAVQARRVMFDGITSDGMRIIDYIPQALIESVNIQQMKVLFKNGSIIQFVGSENYDGLRGSNPVGIVLSEMAYQHPQVYPTLRPILSGNDGWVIMVSTPFGHNFFYDLYKVAEQNPESWFKLFLTVDDTKHISREEIQREVESGEISQDMAEQEYRCFPKDTPILTVQGIINIQDVKVNDLVFSHTGRMRKVTTLLSKDYKGEVVHINSYGSPEIIVCTPEHPIRVYNYTNQKYSWVHAKDITKDHFLVFPKIHLSPVSVITKELCMLIAWYITEGSCSKNHVDFSCGTLKDAQRVKSYADNLNIESTIYKKRTAFSVIINSVNLVDFFKYNCGLKAESKKIPFHLIYGHESDFFHELMVGDGCESSYKGIDKFVYSTVSKSLAYQVQLLAHSINMRYTAGISIRPPYKSVIEGRIVNCLQSYQVNIYKERLHFKKKKLLSYLMRAKNCVAARVRSVSVHEFKGKVYNFSVQYDQSYLVSGRAVHNCNFSLGAIGAYYAKYLTQMETNNQVTLIDWEPNYPVHTAWDLGVRDSTCILFFQILGRRIHVIDMYQKSDVGLEHYVHYLQSLPYTYGKHIAPHDIEVREFTSGAMSRKQKAAQLGVRFMVAPKMSIMDGIESVRTTLPRMYIDNKKCSKLVTALRNYRKEYNSATKTYGTKPLHDHHSDCADALRMMCLSIPKINVDSDPEALERRYQETVYGRTDSSMPRMFQDDNDYRF